MSGDKIICNRPGSGLSEALNPVMKASGGPIASRGQGIRALVETPPFSVGTVSGRPLYDIRAIVELKGIGCLRQHFTAE